MNPTKALFFLRHYNDIDHMVPVMHQWLSAGYAADAVVYSMPEYLNDYRFNLLKSFDAFSLKYIDEFLDHDALNHKRAVIDRPRTGIPKDVRIAELYDDAVIDRIYSECKPDIACFDWIMNTSAAALPVAQRATALAHARGLPIVSLPHGDSPHFNEMIAADDLNFTWRDIYSSGNLFDAVVVPNELCAKRYRPFMAVERIRVLGSPRYNSAWLKYLDALTPTHQFGPHDGLNVVLFLRSPQYPIFWQEVIRTIQMLTQRPGIKLIVKHHTRPNGDDPLRNFYEELEDRPIANLRFAFDDVHSGSLLKWCDVVMDVATSVSFEAVKLSKPVLAMEYLHAGYSTIARYIPNTEMRCRDDVLATMQQFAERGTNSFYRQRDRVHFMSEMIDVPDGEVLPRYVNFLEEMCGAARTAQAA